MLTERQAYDAMYAFLEEYYGQTKSGDVAALLGAMSFLPDGGTADPAAWQDWMKCVQKALSGGVDTRLQLG